VFLLANALLVGLVALRGSYPGAIGVAQDTPGAVLGLAAAAIAAALAGVPGAQFATVLMLIVLATTLTGALMLALGLFKLGQLVRFLPYPVMGGFLAGTGWLLAIGGIGVMTTTPLSVAWLEAANLMHWLPGVALGLIIYAATARLKRPYVFPAVLLLALAGFYGLVAYTQTPLADLRTGNWLFASAGTVSPWQFPLRPGLLAQVDWPVLLAQLPALLPVALISVIALLLNTSGLELIVKKDLDLNRELVAAGLGNLAAGVLGGLVGYHAISLSTLNHTLSSGRRLVGVLTAVLVGATVFVGPAILLFIPKLILGGVLFYLGWSLLVEWIYQAWFKFPRVDFLVIVIILLIIIARGFLEGILVGLVMAVAMFVVSYSRVSVIRFAFNAREYRSRMVRAPQECALLEAHGAGAFILKLEGFIFFGTANNILGKIREQVLADAPSPVRYIVLDFSKVTGLDSTGRLSFVRLAQWSQEHSITLVFAGLAGRALADFRQEPALSASAGVRYVPDLDRGLEWCENEIIRQHRRDTLEQSDLAAQLTAILPAAGLEQLLPYLQRRTFGAGEYLMKEGDTPDVLYFIESGQVTVQLERPGRPPMRLETMRQGRTVGELGFYLGTRRTAHVIAEAASVGYSLSTDDLARMSAEAPEAARTFHQLLAWLLSERLAQLTRTVSALERS
jgi:SulP family sulfate permease